MSVTTTFTCNICKKPIDDLELGVSIDTDHNEVPYSNPGCHASHPMHVCSTCVAIVDDPLSDRLFARINEATERRTEKEIDDGE